MSKVYSFRLDANKPRETKAMDVIDALVEEGFSTRYIMTEALLVLWGENNEPSNLSEILDQLDRILEKFDQGKPKNKVDKSAENQTLTTGFIKAVKDNIRTGIRSDYVIE